MTGGGKSGSLGGTQLLAFVGAALAGAVRAMGRDMHYANVLVEPGDVVAATEYLKANASPEILLIELSSAEAAPAQLDALADVVNPTTKVIVTGSLDSYRFYHWLMDLGIHEYLLQPFTPEQLKTAIVKGTARKAAASADARPPLQKMVAVIGARGGVGTSTIASNLAAIFAREHVLNTALVDLDFYFGSTALGFDLEPVRGMRDALEKPDRVDAIFLERVMVKPFPLLSLLAAEEPLHENFTAQPNAGEMIFGALKEKFSIIVVDMPRQMNPLARYVLAHADQVLLVTEPLLVDFRDALRIRDYLVDQLKRPAPAIVMNRVGFAGKEELPMGEFKKHYGTAPACKLANLPEAFAATTQGELLIDYPKLKGALAPLYALASAFVGAHEADDDAPEKLGGSLLGRFKKTKK
ncbi:MAG: CpaE family protein [Rickettsiales bacterium]